MESEPLAVSWTRKLWCRPDSLFCDAAKQCHCCCHKCGMPPCIGLCMFCSVLLCCATHVCSIDPNTVAAAVRHATACHFVVACCGTDYSV